MILQKIGSEVFHLLVDHISLFINGGIVKHRSLQVGTHEGYGSLITLIIFLRKHDDQGSIKSKGLKQEILVEVGFYRAGTSMIACVET